MNETTLNNISGFATHEELKVIESASRKPFAWHKYRIIPSETKIIRSLMDKGIIKIHPTQNLFKLLSSNKALQ